MKKKSKIYFRADGNTQLGLGHVIRSLALVEMLSTDFSCHFVIRSPSPFLLQQLNEKCQSVIEIPAEYTHLEEAEFLGNEILESSSSLVLDGYQFQTDYQRIIKKSSCRLVCIDDIYECHFLADAIINHTGGLDSSVYSAESYTRFYMGLEYILLRKPFREAARNRNWNQPKEKAIFICLGGADPQNDLWKVLQKLKGKLQGEKLYIVIGGAYQYKEKLEQNLKTEWKTPYELLSNLSAEQMVEYMGRCPVAITSPSSVSYEYLSVGGLLYLNLIADNQKHMLHFLTTQELALKFEQFPFEEARAILQENQENYLDGQQAERLKEIFKN